MKSKTGKPVEGHLSDEGKAKMRAVLRKSEKEKEAILQSLKGLVNVRYLDRDFQVVWTNADMALGPTPSAGSVDIGSHQLMEATRLPHCYELKHGRNGPCLKCGPRDAFETGEVQKREEVEDRGRILATRSVPVKDDTGVVVGVIHSALNITELKKSEDELRRKSDQLVEMNTALRVLLRQREEDKREIEDRIVSNVRELVLPYVHKLKGMHLNEAQMGYLEVVETHLNDVVAPFLRQIISDYPHLTAKELQVLTLVREGKTNKEITKLMHISLNTVEIHRYNLRRKLGLKNKKMNLRSYLVSLGNRFDG